MNTAPNWYIDLVDKTRPALKAFKIDGNNNYDMPSYFLYMSDGDDWYDSDAVVCDIPVYNVSRTCHVYVAQDEDCCLFPIWKGEMTPKREGMLREFQLRFSKSGDF